MTRWTLCGVAAVALLASPSASNSKPLGEAFIASAPEQPIGQELTVADGKPLLVQRVRPARSAKLDASVSVKLSTTLRGMVARDIAVGAVLHGASSDGHLYCAPMQNRYAVCLEDSDGDNRFESAVSAKFKEVVGDFIAFERDPKWSVHGATVGDDAYTLPDPVPYHEAAPEEASSTTLSIYWSRPWGAVRKDGSVQVQTKAALGTQGLETPYDSVIIDKTAGTTISYFGATIQLLGLTGEGSLRYRIVEPFTSDPIRFDSY